MSFASPALLLALIAVPVLVVVYVLLERMRSRRASVWSTPALMPNMMASGPSWRRYVPAGFLLLAIVALLVGFARPEVHVNKAGEGATIVLAVDNSGSMAADDVTPTRLAAADAAITNFLNALPPKYRAALLVFADRASVPVPPTYSRAELIAALPKHTVVQGTALGDAIQDAVQVAVKTTGAAKTSSSKPTAAVLLVSDGGGNSGRIQPDVAAAFAKKSGVPVSTIAVGTSSGSVTQKLTVGGKTYSKETQVPVETATLQQVASTSGGSFYEAGSAQALEQVYEHLRGLPSQGKKPLEITGWVTAGGLVLALCAAFLSGLWFRRLV